MTEGEYFYRFNRSCRSASPARIGAIAGAANASGWPDRIRFTLLQPSKVKAVKRRLSSRLRRWILRRFEPKLDLNRHKTARLVRPVTDESKTPSGACSIADFRSRRAVAATEVGQAAAALRRLSSTLSSDEARSSLSSKLKCNGRRSWRLRFNFAAKGCTETYQAGPMRWQRRRSPLFEPAMLIGTKNTTDRNHDVRLLLYLNPPIVSCTPASECDPIFSVLT
jgi:hypothetical protein